MLLSHGTLLTTNPKAHGMSSATNNSMVATKNMYPLKIVSHKTTMMDGEIISMVKIWIQKTVNRVTLVSEKRIASRLIHGQILKRRTMDGASLPSLCSPTVMDGANLIIQIANGVAMDGAHPITQTLDGANPFKIKLPMDGINQQTRQTTDGANRAIIKIMDGVNPLKANRIMVGTKIEN